MKYRSFLARITRIAAAAALAAGAAAAQAALLVYDFQVTIGSDTYSGSFSYDNASAPTGQDVYVPGDTLYALSNFSFDFRSVMYTEADLSPAEVAELAGSFASLESTEVNGLFSFYGVGTTPSFVYDFGGGDAGSADVVYTLVPGTPLPEPAGLTLALLALALLGMASRTRRSM